MRPTLVRWCERTEAVRPPPTRFISQQCLEKNANGYKRILIVRDVYAHMSKHVHLFDFVSLQNPQKIKEGILVVEMNTKDRYYNYNKLVIELIFSELETS